MVERLKKKKVKKLKLHCSDRDLCLIAALRQWSAQREITFSVWGRMNRSCVFPVASQEPASVSCVRFLPVNSSGWWSFSAAHTGQTAAC